MYKVSNPWEQEINDTIDKNKYATKISKFTSWLYV